jgi:hypothetical protein
MMKGSTSLHQGKVELLEENCFSIIFDHRSRSSKTTSYTLGKGKVILQKSVRQEFR